MCRRGLRDRLSGMTTLLSSRIRNTHGPALCATAGITALGLAVYQVATPGTPSASYDTVADFVREGLLLAWLAASVLAAGLAERAGLAPRAAARLIGVGYGLIFVGVAVGVALRDDPDWFMLLGGPGQLLSMAGFVTWMVWALRGRRLPMPLALLGGVGGLVAILGSEIGLSVLIAGFWFGLAQRWSRTTS